MALGVYRQVRKAFRDLNPREIRAMADKQLRIGIVAPSAEAFAAIENTLIPQVVSSARRSQIEPCIYRAAGPLDAYDLVLVERHLPRPRGAFSFDLNNPARAARAIIDEHPDLAVALARNFCPFRKPVIDLLIRRISKENAAFALLTALPDVIPNILELPWALGEFASDTAFLTLNQIRMALVIAGASNHEVGYSDQSTQIAAIVGGALGWRALARELVGKIPLGGGLIPKAAIAYAGTYTVGIGLERFYRIGYGLTRWERREVYGAALEHGKGLAASLLGFAKSKRMRSLPGG